MKMEEKESVTSMKVTLEMKQYKKESGLSWEKICSNGIYLDKLKTNFEDLARKHTELKTESDLLEIQLRKKGRMLAKYIEKYGIVDDIVYKTEE